MDKFMEIAGKIGAQKHMSAIRDGFASTMPLVMAGAITVMINNVLFVPWSLLAGFIGADNGFIVWANTYVAPLFSAVDAGSLSLTALAIAIALGYIRAQQENVDALASVLIATGAFFILGPKSRISDVAAHIGDYYGAMGILVGLLVGLIAPAIFTAIVKKGWIIKMPDMVPPAVGRAFAAIIPGFITLMAFALVPYAFSLMHTLEILGADAPANIFVWFEVTIQQTLMGVFGGTDASSFLPGLLGASLIKLVQTVLWFAGLHGANLTTPVTTPIWGTFDTLNVQEFAKLGKDAVLFPWTSTSWVIYADLGGSGATLGLLIALKLFNKRPDAKEIASISLAPGLFEINEPIIFGIPMVLNPIYLFPFLFATPIMSAVGFILTWIGFAGRVVNNIPWTTPPILGAAMATNFNIGAIITSIICLAVSVAIYTPFVFLANKEFENQLADQAK